MALPMRILLSYLLCLVVLTASFSLSATAQETAEQEAAKEMATPTPGQQVEMSFKTSDDAEVGYLLYLLSLIHI